jgi:hypothetical protein
VHTAIFLAELGILWVAVRYMRTPPQLWVTAATLALVPFALGLELSAGNILSIWQPKKLEFQMMGRQRTPQVSALLALAVHGVVIAASGVLFVLATHGRQGYAIAGLLVLDAGAVGLYAFILVKAETLAMTRRESMFEALCRE